MSTIIPQPSGGSSSVFDVLGNSIRFGVTEDGRAYSVAADYAKAMGYTRTSDALKILDDDEKGTAICRTPGGSQQMGVIYEDGLWELIFRSTLPGAKAIKKRVKAILQEIRRTGRYESTPQQLTNRDLARMVLEEADRADRAEETVSALEGGDGLTIRSFHKKYFSDVAERVFFEHLYSHHLLLDQRGKGSEREDGTHRDGSQHRHPSYKGKHFFYLHGGKVYGGKRRETARVRPGPVELELKALLITQGLPANNNQCGPLAIDGPTQTALSLDEAGAA